MKKVKYPNQATSLSRLRLIKLLLGILFLYLIFITFQFLLQTPQLFVHKQLDPTVFNRNTKFDVMARDAILSGKNLWGQIVSGKYSEYNKEANDSGTCPNFVSLLGDDIDEFVERGKVFVIPCGLELGSHVTVVGKPKYAHYEKTPKIRAVKVGEGSVLVSQFMVELQGLRGEEDVPKMLHFNPRLKGDWSGRAVIEQNTCFRNRWGDALRCEGWRSNADEETVDGQVKCEKWIRDGDDDNLSEEIKATWWLNRFEGSIQKVGIINWPFPFVEGKLFVLTLLAGLEGYHINVDGRHITSFPYRSGFSLEDATGLSVREDVAVHSIFAASLPTTHPSFAPLKHLEMLPKWQAPRLPDAPVEFFVGIISASNHFAERMAVRKSWMQHEIIKSLSAVARFFVALDRRKEVNAKLITEAEYFGDIVVVPYMDNYDLVVLKTVALCQYGVRTVAARYIMKCDDDSFVRIDVVVEEAKKVANGSSLYFGNMNYNQKPLRHGKEALTYEEWPEEVYPPYASGQGYIISSDIAQYVVSEFDKHKLRLFKMEDVSMGMWVGKFNNTRPVEYIHSLNFCPFGCIEGFYTAHDQSPKQMICLWENLKRLQKPQCCSP